MRWTGKRRLPALVAGVGMAALLAACGGTAAQSGGGGGGGDSGPPWVVGVSNTLVGNGWREEMICSVKAEALASGKVSEVVVANRNVGPSGQIADLRNLISQGVDAIIVNPSDPEKLNNVIEQAVSQDIVVVAVDQAVTTEKAYVAANDQKGYGRLGGEWLAKALGGEGKVVEMRGIAGAPADTDRHEGFMEALSDYPDIEVVKEVYTGWDYTKGGKQALDILNSSLQVDGIWTSGIDYTVVKAFQTLNKQYVPIVGADNNEFINQLLTLSDKGLEGAAVTNPAAIGGVGTAIALDVLSAEEVDRMTMLEPEVWDVENDRQALEEHYFPDRAPTFSAQVTVEPYTHYTPEQLLACRGPSE